MARIVTAQGQQFELPDAPFRQNIPGVGENDVLLHTGQGRFDVLSRQAYEARGGSFNALPVFNLGADTTKALSMIPGSQSIFNPVADPASFFQSQYKSPVITQKVNPQNPNQLLSTSSETGLLAPAVSTEDVLAGVKQRQGQEAQNNTVNLLRSASRLTGLPPAQGYLQQGYKAGDPVNIGGQQYRITPNGDFAPIGTPIPTSTPTAAPIATTQQGGGTLPYTAPQTTAFTGITSAAGLIQNAQIAKIEKDMTDLRDKITAGIPTIKREEILTGLFTKFGVEEAQNSLATYNKIIFEQKKVLQDLPEAIQKSLQNVGVTQAQLTRLIARDSVKPIQALNDTMAQAGAQQDRINQALKFVGLFSDAKLQDQAAQIEAWKFQLEESKEDLKNLREDQKDALARATEEKKTILTLQNDLLKNGAPKSYVDAIAGAQTTEEAYMLAQPFYEQQAKTKQFDDAMKQISELVRSNAPISEVAPLIKDIGVKYGISTDDIVRGLRDVPEALNTQVVEVAGRKILINTKTGQTIKDLGIAGNMTMTLQSATPDQQPYIDAFNSAVLGLPAERAKQARATFTNYMNSGDLDGAKNYIIRTAMVGAGVDQQNQVVARKTMIDSAMEIKALLNNIPTNLVTGSLEKLTQKLGESSNKDMAYIGNRITFLLQTYRRGMTGVAFSPPEAAEYAKIMPDIQNIGSLNVVKIDSLIDAVDLTQRSALSFYIGDENYEQIFGKRQIPLLPSERTLESFKQRYEQETEGEKETEGEIDYSFASFFSNIANIFK